MARPRLGEGAAGTHGGVRVTEAEAEELQERPKVRASPWELTCAGVGWGSGCGWAERRLGRRSCGS